MRPDGNCRACNAPIRWGVHETTGKRMPLNPSPVIDGNVVVVDWQNRDTQGEMATPIVGVGAKAIARAVTVYRYVSHFATCPKANRFRGKAKR